MKKFSILLATISLLAVSKAQVMTQNNVPNTVATTGSVACAGPAAGPNYYTSDNSYIRLFKLSDYGITYDYKITNIAFGVQLASRTLAGSSTDIGGTFPVEVWVYTTTGTTLTGTLTSVSGTNPLTTVNVSSTNNGGMVNTGTTINQTIPSGQNIVLELWHDGNTGKTGTATSPFERFYMGTHPGGQTAPSYLSSEGCSLLTPIATGTGALANFASAQWVMTITGQNAVLGTTEVINSRDLQIYPNPVTDKLKFIFNNRLKSKSIEITDMSGKVITSISETRDINEVDMSSYPKGNYILRVRASDEKVYIQKIIKN